MRRRLSRLVPLLPVVGAIALSGCGTAAHSTNGADTSHISPSTSPTSVRPSSAQPNDPRRVHGTVYSLAMPAGWRNTTRADSKGSPQVDLSIGIALPSGGYVAVKVLNPGSRVPPSRVAAEASRQALVRDLTNGNPNAKVARTPTLMIDHERALGGRTSASVSGQRIEMNVYLPTHLNRLYSVLLYYPPTDRRQAAQAFRSIVASWQWAT